MKGTVLPPLIKDEDINIEMKKESVADTRKLYEDVEPKVELRRETKMSCDVQTQTDRIERKAVCALM